MDFIEINKLIDDLKKLPNITTKQAEKISYYLLNANSSEINELINDIDNLRKKITFCNECNNISLSKLCEICLNTSRNKKQLCIVQSPNDVQKIESTNKYLGVYFVLHDEINVKNKTKLNQTTIKKLLTLINKNEVSEIILATNWTPNGEATAFFLKGIINQMYPNILISRLAVGLPINSSLSYADNDTLSQAIKNRTKYE